MRLPREEITRKLFHLPALGLPIGIFYLPRYSFSKGSVALILLCLLATSVAVELIRFRYPGAQRVYFNLFGSMLRKDERFKMTGTTWIIASALLCAVLFSNVPHIAFMVLFLFIVGDAVAALVGMGAGRLRIGNKTLEGSLGCFLVCLILFYGVFPLFPGLLDAWGNTVPAAIAFAAAFAVTVFELIPLRISRNLIINDNIAVPVIAGYAMLGMEKILGM